MKMMMEKSCKWGRKKLALFIAMEKAFYCVQRKMLWKIMSEPPYSVLQKVVRVIKSIYRNSVSKVRK